MGRRKARKPWLRLVGKADMPRHTIVDWAGIADQVRIPSDEKVIIKEVPAKVDGVIVGEAQIYEDGTVGVIIFDDAPQWAKDKIQAEADKIGFSIGGD